MSVKASERTVAVPEQESEEKTQELTEVVADSLHEVRRPLALARGYLSVMMDGELGELSERQRDWLRKTEEKLLLTQSELERLALLARLESTHPPSFEAVDLVDQVRAAERRTGGRRELSEGSLTVRAPDTPVPANVDTVLLARILDNLLENAIAYVDGPPNIVIEVQDGGAQPAVRVTDNGIGIDPALAPRIFERGVRGSHSGRRGGSGLGLHLSRAAAEQMRGQLMLERSKPGRGSSFLLLLQPAVLADGAEPHGPR
jgi:two-component system, OmpR family, sensor kinase